MTKIRVGFGYDVHRLVEGRELWLGGIKIEHTLGLLGHSDADVLAQPARLDLADVDPADRDAATALGQLIELVEQGQCRHHGGG